MVGVDLLGEDEREPRDGEGVSDADEHVRQRARQDDVPDQAQPAQSDRARGFDQVGVDVADTGVGVEVEREGDAEGDQRDLRRLTDAEPDDEQRDEADERYCPDHLDRGVDEILTEPEQPGEQRQGDPDGSPEQHAGTDPPQRDPDRPWKITIADEIAERGDHRPRGGEQFGGGAATPTRELP